MSKLTGVAAVAELSAAIDRAVTARELHGIADAAARTILPTNDRELLQVKFARRTRQLFPGIVR